MKQQHLKILRYNTGTDKKAFVQFKDFFDAAIFNATIVAYSGASVADLISMHSRRYIIDPQTHIFQQELSAYTTENKKTHIPAIKKSVTKYLEKMPAALADKILKLHQKPEPELIAQNLDALVECVYAFQTEFVNTFIVQKEYDKYLKFANMGPRPKLVIAPYFMIKSEDSYSEKQMWLHYNRVCLEKTIALNEQQKEEEIAAQLVLEKDVLSEEFIEMVASTYDLAGYEYIFFVGYSLPIADFEFRYMLQKNVTSSAKIDVILTPNSNPDLVANNLKDLLPSKRYLDAFPKNKVSFYYEGFGPFFSLSK